MTVQAKQRPGPILRALYRAPLVAYRFGLAGREHWLGLRWILIETRGRRTGRRHAVLVDLLGEEPESGRHFVQSAYGGSADWVRNVEANRRLQAQVGTERFAARLESVEPMTARRVMLAYRSAHPLYSPFIAWILGYHGPLRSAEEVAEWLVAKFGMLAIVREAERSQAD